MSAGIILLCVAFQLLVFSRTLSQSLAALDRALKSPVDSNNSLLAVLGRVRQFWSQLCDVSALLVTISFLCGLFFLVVDDTELSVPMLRGGGVALLLWSAVVLLKVIALQNALQQAALELDASNAHFEPALENAATRVSIANGILLTLHGFGVLLGVGLNVLWFYLS